MKILISLIFLNLSFTTSFAKADNYDDCLLENLKGVTSDTAAKAIIQVCFNKYKKKESTSENKGYWKEVCSRKNTNRFNFEGEWDKNYNYLVIALTNETSEEVWAKFKYRKSGSKKDSDFIYTGNNKTVSSKTTSIFKIWKNDIIYENFNYSFDVSFEDCNKKYFEN